MAIVQVNNGDTGLVARGRINETIDHANTNTGWAQYLDTQYTEASPLVVTQGTTVNLPNNALSVIETQLPTDSAGFYDGTRITPDANGDSYAVRTGFKIKSSSQTGAFALDLDISALGDGSILVFERNTSLTKGANTEQAYSTTNLVYTLGTFLANGGLTRFTSVAGTSSVYDITYVISKVHGAR